jgi:hypothetical protein
MSTELAPPQDRQESNGAKGRDPIGITETRMNTFSRPSWRICCLLILFFFGLGRHCVWCQTRVVQTLGETKHGKSKPLSGFVKNPPHIAANKESKVEHRVRLLPIPKKLANAPPIIATSVSQGGVGDLDVVEVQQFKGVGFDRNYQPKVSPPDTNGSVGPNEYVQWVNQAYGIFDKKTRDLKVVVDQGSGKSLKTVWDGNVLWQGFGGKCEFSNDGDPVVVYDKLADRWVMSQFAYSKPAGPPYSQCVAVSSTPDPASEYFRYEFQFNNFNDYPKIGVWPDGYYAAFNMFEYPDGGDFLGTKLCVFERAKMLKGETASVQCVNLYSPQYAGILPADFDGTVFSQPPVSPAYFVGIDSDKLNIWKFFVDWNDSTKSVFDRTPIAIPTSPFEFPCAQNDYTISCIPQPGDPAQPLEALGDRLMYRLAYRSFGSRESLVVNHTVKVGERTGIRWYEIENLQTAPSIRQQGTYAPDDGLFRWMGSIAMDKKGDMILEYSVSSSAVFPSIRYTGRRFDDPLGQMRNERMLVAGKGSQINGTKGFMTDRWGDYSSVSVDPSDDCTFWVTNQFQAQPGIQDADGIHNTYDWSTSIGTLRFPDCK